MAKINDTIRQHSDAIDSVVSEFQRKFDIIVKRSSLALISELRRTLDAPGDIVSSISKNQKILAKLDERYLEMLHSNGYDDLVQGYVDSFSGQFEWFDRVLADINGELFWPVPKPSFTKADMAEMRAYQNGAKGLITDVVGKVANRAKTQAVLSSGGMSVKELTGHISETLGTSTGESASLAETSISSYYRTITDKGYQQIEDDLPAFKIRYNYEGPLDKITRPFCTKLERQSRDGKSWARADIEKMKNGQLPNVFVTAGGYRCRHQWVISVADLTKAQRGTKPPNKTTRTTSKRDVAREIAAKRELHAQTFRAKTGVDLPHEQIANIRAGVEGKIAEMRQSNV